MTVALRRAWTQEEFLDWAERQDGRFEFDGAGPVAMVGGTNDHSAIALNIGSGLRTRLRGTGCRVFGESAAVETANGGLRYPDVSVTCSAVEGTARKVNCVVVVFEVVSPSSGRMDHYTKVGEYAGVASILRYVIVESTAAAILVMSRSAAGENFTAMPLQAGDVLALPEIGVTLPVDEIYEDIDFGE